MNTKLNNNMHKLIFLFIFTFVLTSCRDKGTAVAPNTASLLSLNSWQLDRYTDESGKSIANSNLNISAVALYGLLFEFNADNVTRALDKVNKSIINKGTWALIDNNKTIDINISAFKGQFKVVSIAKGKLVLQTPTGSFLTGVGPSINMEFSEFK
jgi:hypothetical protein